MKLFYRAEWTWWVRAVGAVLELAEDFVNLLLLVTPWTFDGLALNFYDWALTREEKANARTP